MPRVHVRPKDVGIRTQLAQELGIDVAALGLVALLPDGIPGARPAAALA